MVNSCTFIGRVGQKPETRILQSGEKVSSFSMALSEKWKDKNGEKVEKTIWINCFVFGKQSEIIEQYVDKGALLFVEAKYQLDVYEKDGVKMNAPKFIVKSFTMLGGKQEEQSQPSSVSAKPQNDPISEVFEDDLPF